MAERVAGKLVSVRWWLLLGATLLFIASSLPASRLSFDRRIEQMFPAWDPSVEAYELLRSRFGGNAVAMMVYRDDDLMSVEGIAQVSQLAERTSQIPGIIGVLSLAQVNDALSRSQPIRLLGIDAPPPILGDDNLATGFRELFADYTHDRSGHYAAIVAMLDPTKVETHGATIASLRALLENLQLKNQPAALVGEPVLVAEGFELVERDGQRLATTTIILLGLATFVMFRSWRWVLAELLLILWSVVLTRGVASIVGMQLSMVSSMLTAIVTVIAVACVIHIAVQFGTRRRRGDLPEVATRRTLREVLPPIFWACLTDAAGFAALAISEVGPVRDFGLMMTLGTAMVLLGVIMVLPAVILMPPQRFVMRAIPLDRRIRRVLVQMVLCLNHRRLVVVVGSIVVMVITGIGLTRLVTETNFIRNFRASSELARGYAMVETELGGAGVWDIVLPAPSQWTPEYLASVRELETELRGIRIKMNPPSRFASGFTADSSEEEASQTARLTKVLSMADADEVAKTSPLLSLANPGVRIAGMRAAMPAFVDALLTKSDGDQQQYLRIMLRSAERLPAAAKLELIRSVEDVVARHTRSEAWRSLVLPLMADGVETSGPLSSTLTSEGRVTGYYVLLARLIESLLSDQWLCLGVATLAIFLMMTIASRSVILSLVCMIPNVLPVLAVMGVLGILGVRVNMGAAMIAAVSVGLTIDGSIHFLHGFLAARRRGALPLKAAMHAQRRVGLPVLLATLALALGFSVLATSTFIPTVTFGLLVTAALAAGTAANLTLLPLLLLLTMHSRQ